MQRSGCGAGPLRAELVHPPRGLADALLAGDDDPVEDLAEQVVGIAVDAPGVGDEAGAHARVVGTADRLDHRQIGFHGGEQAVDQPVRLDLEDRRQRQLEAALVDLALLERDQQLASAGPVAQAVHQDLRIESGAHAVGVEGAEQAGGEHAAPVDQESFKHGGPRGCGCGSRRRLGRARGTCADAVAGESVFSPAARY